MASFKDGARISVFVAFGAFCVWLENGAAFHVNMLISRIWTASRMSVFVAFGALLWNVDSGSGLGGVCPMDVGKRSVL